MCCGTLSILQNYFIVPHFLSQCSHAKQVSVFSSTSVYCVRFFESPYKDGAKTTLENSNHLSRWIPLPLIRIIKQCKRGENFFYWHSIGKSVSSVHEHFILFYFLQKFGLVQSFHHRSIPQIPLSITSPAGLLKKYRCVVLVQLLFYSFFLSFLT